MLIHCPQTEHVRSIHRTRLKKLLGRQDLTYLEHYVNNEEALLILLIDCSRLCSKSSKITMEIDSICRDWVYAVHVERLRLLKTV